MPLPDGTGLGRGRIIRIDDLDPEVTAKLPSTNFPIGDADITSLSATKLLGGVAGKFIGWVGAAAAWVNLVAGDITAALGFTPENVANKGQPNGYAGLDATSKLTNNILSNSQLAAYPADGTKFLKGDGTWGVGSALPAGADGNVIQYVGAVGTAQDLKIGTKPVDNTVIPTDGMVLTYDNASGKVKFKTVASGSVSEVQFLQGQAALGKLIMATGSTTAATTVVCSYTPANGTTFVLYQAKGSYDGGGAAATGVELRLRNNGTLRESTFFAAIVNGFAGQQFTVKGDQLIGDGIKVYDLFNVSALTTQLMSGAFTGYLL